MLYELGNRFKLQYDCYLVKKKPKLLDLTSNGASKTESFLCIYVKQYIEYELQQKFYSVGSVKCKEVDLCS